MTVPHSTSDAVQFLQGWCEGGPWVLTAISPDGGGIDTITFKSSELPKMRDWIEDRQGVQNLYFTVNPTRGPMNIKPKKSDIRGMRAIHVDVDPRAGEDPAAEKERAIQLLRDYKPTPTIIIDSGNGAQAFWVLDGEHATPDEASRADAERRNLFVETVLQADACHNIDRIMRLPGTVNVPGAKKRKKGCVPALASVVDLDWSRTYSLDDFPRAEIKEEASTGARAPVVLSANLPRVESLDDLGPKVSDKLKAMIVQGTDPDDPGKYSSRSEAAWAVMCMMVRAECTDDQIAAVILDPDYKISGHVLDQPRPQQYAARQIQRAREEATDPDLRRMNDRHAFVTYGDKGRILFEQPGRPPLFLEKQTFLDMYANQMKELGKDKDGDTIKMAMGKWWFQKAERRQYERVEFLPAMEAPGGTYNLWRGPAVVPKAGDCGLYLELVREVIAAGDAVVSEYLFNWMALKLQQLNVKLQTSIALRGGQGLGKSVFAENYGSLFGDGFVGVTDMKQLTGNFNAHLQRALLVFGDEMSASSNPQIVGRLKSMVTQRRIRIEPKGVDSFEAENYFALILASNNPHIVTTDADDRRYLVLDVSDARKNDLKFFRDLDDQWRAGGREAFAAFLMARDLTGFEHRRKPRTSADDDVVEMSLSGPERDVHDLLSSGETPTVWRDGVPHHTLHDGKTGEVFLNSGDVAQSLTARRRGGWTADPVAIGRLLKKLSGIEGDVPRISVHGKQVKGVWLPPLPEARRRWCAMHGRDFDWGEGEGACWDVVGMPERGPAGQDETPF